jgi:hypothetical protein
MVSLVIYKLVKLLYIAVVNHKMCMILMLIIEEEKNHASGTSAVIERIHHIVQNLMGKS